MNNRHPRSFRFSCGLDEKKKIITLVGFSGGSVGGITECFPVL